jgi:two-component system, OmpR family, response regulator
MNVKVWGEKHPETIFPFPKLRVLCVDDNRDTADSAGILLDIYGCDVVVCYDAETAFTTALQFKPDICLIDLNMPQRGGCELARRLRAWSREHPLRLIAVTAYGSEETRKASFAAGFDLHFVIPVDWDELRNVLAEVGLRLGRALRE